MQSGTGANARGAVTRWCAGGGWVAFFCLPCTRSGGCPSRRSQFAYVVIRGLHGTSTPTSLAEEPRLKLTSRTKRLRSSASFSV